MRIGLEYFNTKDGGITLVLVDNGARTVAFIAKGKVDYNQVLTIGEVQTVDQFMVDAAVEGSNDMTDLMIAIINRLAERVNWGLY